jgi:hypothetical protein
MKRIILIVLYVVCSVATVHASNAAADVKLAAHAQTEAAEGDEVDAKK